MLISEAEVSPLLDIKGISGGYGKVAVLHDVSLRINAGEVVSLLGPNGAGKTTLLRIISGLLPKSEGQIIFSESELAANNPRAAVNRGLVHVIEGHRIFTELTVMDNLLIAAFDISKAERMARVEEALAIFPEIAAKRKDRGGALSGGQQQMLAVAQAMVKRPRLLMLDEPSAGLSPVLVDRVLAVAARLRETGGSVLLVEQLVEKALAVSDRVYALAQGRIVLTASAKEANLPARLENSYFGTSR